MNNHYCFIPIKTLFCKGTIARIGSEMRDAGRVQMLHGGSAVRRKGVCDHFSVGAILRARA